MLTWSLLARERCIKLLSEDPEREALRDSLEREQRKLAKAQEWLLEYERDERNPDVTLGYDHEAMMDCDWDGL